MIITIDGQLKLNDLKKLIEKEYFNVYPFEQNFICSNVQDEFGYNLTLCDSLENFLKNNDRIIVEYSTEYIDDNNNKKQYQAYQILQNLHQFQIGFSKQLSSCDFQQSEKEKIVDLIHKIFYLCFSTDLKIQKSINIFLKEFCQKTDFLKFLKISEKLNYLATSAIIFWAKFYLQSNAVNYLIVDNISCFMQDDNIRIQIKGLGLSSIITQQIGNENLSPGVRKKLLYILKQLSCQQKIKQVWKIEQPQTKGDYFNKKIENKYVYNTNKSQDFLDIFTRKLESKKQQNQDSLQDFLDINQQSKSNIQNKSIQSNNDFKEKLKINPNFISKERQFIDQKETNFYQEYLELLNPIVEQNLQYFAIKNISENIHETIYDIIENQNEFLNLANIIKIQVPDSMIYEKQKIIETITDNMRVERAKDLANYNFIETLLTAINIEQEQFRNTYLVFLQTLLKLANFTLDFATIFKLFKSEIYELRISSAQIFKRMTEKMDQNNFMDYGSQLEAYLVEFFDMLKSKTLDQEMQRLLVNILSNLCLIDYIKPQLIYLEGIHLLINKLRNPSNCIETKRAAMRGLFNLSSKSRETKIKILSELNYEFEQLCSQKLDPVIQSFLTALLKANQYNKNIYQGSFSSNKVSDILNFQYIL